MSQFALVLRRLTKFSHVSVSNVNTPLGCILLVVLRTLITDQCSEVTDTVFPLYSSQWLYSVPGYSRIPQLSVSAHQTEPVLNVSVSVRQANLVQQTNTVVFNCITGETFL